MNAPGLIFFLFFIFDWWPELHSASSIRLVWILLAIRSYHRCEFLIDILSCRSLIVEVECSILFCEIPYVLFLFLFCYCSQICGSISHKFYFFSLFTFTGILPRE